MAAEDDEDEEDEEERKLYLLYCCFGRNLAEVQVTQRLFSTNPFFVLAAPLQYSDSYRNNRILRMHTQEMMQQNVKQEGAGGKRVGSLDSWQRSQ